MIVNVGLFRLKLFLGVFYSYVHHSQKNAFLQSVLNVITVVAKLVRKRL